MENFEIGRKRNESWQKRQEHDVVGTASEKNTGRNTGEDSRRNIREVTLNMSVSPICQKNGKKVAYVSFSDGEREAEGEIPSCQIIRNKGFGQSEVEQLESYMKKELASLKGMAAKINVFDAFLGRKP